MKVYLAGPIDYGGDPEARHAAFVEAAEAAGLSADVWCPHCAYDDTLTPDASIAKNMAALRDAQVLVVEWDATTQPSIGTAIEVWHKCGSWRVVVVGTLGRGLFARSILQRRGVFEVETMRDAVANLSVWGVR